MSRKDIILQTFYAKEHKIERVMIALLILSVWALSWHLDYIVGDEIYGNETEQKVIIIDPGHGGKDPGKIGVNGANEDEVNLAISLKLKEQLEMMNYKVILTRDKDDDLCAGDFSKKEDLNNRCYIINKAYQENKSTIMISIHQNSYSDGGVWGAQCFYYAGSDKSKVIADSLQQGFNTMINVGAEKNASESDSYYMLKKTLCPAVIVECGFLSNWSEAEKLVTDDYQQRIVDIIVSNLPQEMEEIQ